MKQSTYTIFVFILLIFTFFSATLAQPPGDPPPRPGEPGGPPSDEPLTVNEDYQAVENTYSGIGTVTMGTGEMIADLSLTPECNTGERFVAAETGVITSDDGTEWIVPMQMTEDGTPSVDMFNPCTDEGDNANYLDDLETVVIDDDGEVITGWIFGDNYFELYINGQFVGRDTIGFVPFNSSAVQFQVNYPYTIVAHLADWETHPGIGMEYDRYNVGDAGFIAQFSDGTITGDDWQCLPVYIAPLDDPACVVEDEFGNPDSSACGEKPTCASENPEMCRALHYELPENWTEADFDHSNWNTATLYEADQVTNQRGYVDYADRFGEASFIWSQNLDLDNQVICRFTVEAP